MTTSAIYQQGGTWYIGIVNTNKHWAFMPDPPKSSKGPSITSAFATAPPPRSFIEYVEAMQQGNEDVLQALANPEIVDLAGEEPQWVFNPLYEAAALQEVEGVIIFDAAENGVDDLAADIVADAEAIAEFLALGLLTTATKKNFSTKDQKTKQPLYKERRAALMTSILSTAQVPDFSLKFNNNTGVDWMLLSYDVQNDWTDRVISSPTSPLRGAKGEMGSQTLSWYYFATTLGLGPADCNMIWQDPNGVRIGVQIHIPIQIYHIGTAPYYQVQFAYPGQDFGAFWTPVDDPSQGYSFNVVGTGYNYTIDVVPTAGGTTFTAVVNMQSN